MRSIFSIIILSLEFSLLDLVSSRPSSSKVSIQNETKEAAKFLKINDAVNDTSNMKTTHIDFNNGTEPWEKKTQEIESNLITNVQKIWTNVPSLGDIEKTVDPILHKVAQNCINTFDPLFTFPPPLH